MREHLEDEAQYDDKRKGSSGEAACIKRQIAKSLAIYIDNNLYEMLNSYAVLPFVDSNE